MFRGRYEHNLDAKGRLALPAAFKKVLGDADTLIITTHLSSPCLVAYPEVEWRSFEERVAKLPQFEPSVMLLRRLYIGSATDCVVDKQNRILIPPVLREHARLQNDVYWVGAMGQIEIWSKALWQAEIEPKRAAVDAGVLAKLAELGI